MTALKELLLAAGTRCGADRGATRSWPAVLKTAPRLNRGTARRRRRQESKQMTAARRAARAEKRNPQVTEPPCRPIRASMRSTTWNCRRGSPAGRLTRTQPQALGPWPVPACTAPSASSSSLPPSGHICRARMDKAPRQRAVRPPGSPAGIRRLASEHRAPVATAVDDQRVTGPSAQRPAARDGGCWPSGPGRTRTTTQHPASTRRGALCNPRFRARTPGRDLHGLDTGVGQDRVKRCGELPGPVADQEPATGGALTEIDQGRCGSAAWSMARPGWRSRRGRVRSGSRSPSRTSSTGVGG